MVKIDVDVMINNGRTFYGRIKKEVEGRLVFGDDGVVECVDNESITKIVLERFPTLKGKKFYVCFNN